MKDADRRWLAGTFNALHIQLNNNNNNDNNKNKKKKKKKKKNNNNNNNNNKNGHMTYDVTWSPKVMVVPPIIWSLISQKPCEIDGRFKMTTFRKPHIRKVEQR